MFLSVTWIGADGSVWPLEGELTDLAGVVLAKPSGLTSKLDRSTMVRPNGVGVDVANYAIPAIQGSLDVRVHPDKAAGLSLGDVWRAWCASWSMINPGELVVSDSSGYRWRLQALLESPIDAPAVSPEARGVPFIDSTVNLLATGGVWHGESVASGGNTVQVFNPGDLPTFPRVGWIGQGKHVTPPTGGKIQLPTSSDWVWLSTNPGLGYRVENEAGETKTAVWASMRGRPVPGILQPGATASWSMHSDVRIEVVPACTNPWR